VLPYSVHCRRTDQSLWWRYRLGRRLARAALRHGLRVHGSGRVASTRWGERAREPGSLSKCSAERLVVSPRVAAVPALRPGEPKRGLERAPSRSSFGLCSARERAFKMASGASRHGYLSTGQICQQETSSIGRKTWQCRVAERAPSSRHLGTHRDIRRKNASAHRHTDNDMQRH